MHGTKRNTVRPLTVLEYTYTRGSIPEYVCVTLQVDVHRLCADALRQLFDLPTERHAAARIWIGIYVVRVPNTIRLRKMPPNERWDVSCKWHAGPADAPGKNYYDPEDYVLPYTSSDVLDSLLEGCRAAHKKKLWAGLWYAPR